MKFLEKRLEDATRLARLKRGFYLGVSLIALAEVVLPQIFKSGEHHFMFESFPAWGSIYGLLCCLAIIVVSKLIGKIWLIRREDYYEE